MPGEPGEKLLVFSFMGMGDNVMSLQALSFFEEKMDSIQWICKSDSAELLTETHSRRNIFVMDLNTVRAPFRSFLASIRLVARILDFLRQRRDNSAVILDYKWKPVFFFGMLCRLAGIKYVISCTQSHWVNLLLSKAIAMTKYVDRHEVERYKDLFAFAGLALEAIPKPPIERYFPQILVSPPPKAPERFILIAPGSYRGFKRWRTINYHSIAKLLVSAKVNFAVVGGIEDAALATEILRGIDPKVGRGLCGKLKIKELMAEIARADLVLSNDSAVMHLADLAGIPVVALFGVTRPERCGPYNQSHTSLRASCPESGSYSFGEFPDFDDSCVNRISVEDVWNAVIKRLN